MTDISDSHEKDPDMKTQEYCGEDLDYPPTDFAVKAHPWDVDGIHSQFTTAKINLSADLVAEKQQLLWLSTITEHHAEHFCQQLAVSNVKLSPEFLAFENVWRRDEYNHYIGFRLIYNLLYGIPVEELANKVDAIVPDFSAIEHYFEDEFKVCLILAYDEIATTKHYAGEYSFYNQFGDPVFYEWIKRVTMDEWCHFQNCMEIIRLRHSDRISEIPQFIDEFLLWDKAAHEYKNTFVFDHFWYPEEFLEHCGRLIVHYFDRRQNGKSKALQKTPVTLTA